MTYKIILPPRFTGRYHSNYFLFLRFIAINLLFSNTTPIKSNNKLTLKHQNIHNSCVLHRLGR
ncbi:hypothetical protein CIT292_08202 [Citrobacter youngae ATCC 29220]|uniref:Uncharacterized protein n=1 Tax=Citrobacter youngae ATCC 29220 TaxID=500640 RepID=D4BCI8_9ENTR|nr:hypothetical protein CIT292_08202 [Citrobacter youngae ATCC 29220]